MQKYLVVASDNDGSFCGNIPEAGRDYFPEKRVDDDGGKASDWVAAGLPAEGTGWVSWKDSAALGHPRCALISMTWGRRRTH